MRSVLLLAALAACTEPVPGYIGDELGEPTRHARPDVACTHMLALAFPEVPPEAWHVHDCGDMGVKASLHWEDGSVSTYAVIPAGYVYSVRDGTWELTTADE